ncbi:hypothetical protein RND81_01G064500 [Saponaria officinalis]|uniref:Uncharacterized protein n=1 Tax=Saponaria officinalis TaxID=3572 RepID=A0AAW1ND54_SAPOF
MDQKDDEPPPFWLQSTTTLRQVDRHRRRNRHATSLFLNTGVLVSLLLVTAFLFMIIVIPYILSIARQVFNPSLVKTSWSSLNIVLVLFAIVCGFLSRKEDDPVTPVNIPTRKDGFKPEHDSSPYYGYYDRGGYNSFRGQENNVIKLRRSSSSYPDLRHESSWMVNENKLRFNDDTDVENYASLRSDSLVSESRSIRKSGDNDKDEDHSVLKNIEVDTLMSNNNKQEVLDHESKDNASPSSSSLSSPSPSVIDEAEDKPTPPSQDQEIVEEIFEGEIENFVVEDESSSTNNIESVDQSNDVLSTPTQQQQSSFIPPPSPPMNILPPPSPSSYFWPSPSPPPPPPPPPPSRRGQSKPKKEINQTFETIGYGRYRWNNNSLSTRQEHKSKIQPPPAPPAPPQRLKPVVASQYFECKRDTSVKKMKGVNVTKDFFTSFYNQSKRKRKHHKRRSYENLEFIEPPPKTSIHRSMSTPEFPPPSPPPPPPPPPPPHSVFHTIFSKKPKTKKKIHSIPTTTRTTQPPPPPPPPPPPFKLKPWKFTIKGDYAKIESNNNSPRSGYSASEDESISPNSAKTNQIPKSPLLFCQSPDVNMKADDFIAKFRAKLTLEKSDSINLKHGYGPSRLRPDFI